MSKSKAQQFAQNRNRSGGTLKGVIKNLKVNIRESCTSKESDEIDKAITILDKLYKNWSNNYEKAKEELL